MFGLFTPGERQISEDSIKNWRNSQKYIFKNSNNNTII